MAQGKAAVSPIHAWSRPHWPTCLQGVAVVAITMALPAFSPAAAVFTLVKVPLPAVTYSSVVCGDFNNDGKPDVLLAGADGSFSGICQVWQNGSNGAFTNLGANFPGISSSAVARGDFDNDGKADLLITGYAGLDGSRHPTYVSQVWRNLGNGNFTNLQAGLPGVDTGAVALGDFDNDGYLDILLTGYSSTGAVAQIWRNLGNGRFTNINAGLPGVFYSSVAWGDYDHDGRLDILLAGTSTGFASAAVTQVWRNQGNGTFAKITVGLPGVSLGSVAWGDFDQDRRLDILLTGYSKTGAVCQVWRNLGNGAFTNINMNLPAVYWSCVALGDYDNDGKLDVALGGVDASTNLICQVWRNTGNWTFTNLKAELLGIHSGSIAWADLDNDGRLDLVLTGLDDGGHPLTKVYHNNTARGSITAPRINILEIPGNGGHQLYFDGEIGFGYTVWASTNLIQWTLLGAPNESGPATFQFTDRAVQNVRKRFYRLSRP